MEIRNSQQFGRRIKRIERAFENVKEYTLNNKDVHTTTSFIADAKIKKHYDITRYHLLLAKAQSTISECRAKYGQLGITKVVKEIINSIK